MRTTTLLYQNNRYTEKQQPNSKKLSYKSLMKHDQGTCSSDQTEAKPGAEIPTDGDLYICFRNTQIYIQSVRIDRCQMRLTL